MFSQQCPPQDTYFLIKDQILQEGHERVTLTYQHELTKEKRERVVCLKTSNEVFCDLSIHNPSLVWHRKIQHLLAVLSHQQMKQPIFVLWSECGVRTGSKWSFDELYDLWKLEHEFVAS